ncbi:hypothetical protein AA0115_g12352 [Alternaria tenuissima]|uniref:Heterokaryon incompatibility domain-containing protein n=1 Tax=Alternaria tenuissima TaxID=119927 RepID=A0AB37W3M8_9PLEO|nr:hypothetical protein AA0115_g12352 [Alternaria tenuissima]
MHRLENLPSRHPASPSPDPSPDAGIGHDDLIAFSNLDMKSTVQTLYRQIEEYCYRRLSFREDVIKAVTGIINAFELVQGTDRIRATQVFGLPIFYSQTSSTFCLPSEKKCSPTVFTPTSTFAYSLIWSMTLHDGSRYSGVTDTLFPSWSWAIYKAHHDPISAGGFAWETSLVNFSCEESLQVWIHDESGSSLELDQYIKAGSQEDDRLLVPKISIRSWVVSFNGAPYRNGNVDDAWALAWGFKKDFIMLDCPETPPSDGLAAIYLGSNQSSNSTDDEKWKEAILLMVEKVDDSTWCRIGVLRCTRKRVSHRESTLAWLNRIKRGGGGWEMRTLCSV